MKQARFLSVFVTLALVLSARSLEAQVPFQHGGDFSALLRAACHGLQHAVGLFDPCRIFAPLADGGGDGGSGDGSGSGDGGSSGDSSGSGDGGSSGDSSGSSDGGASDGSSSADAGGVGDGSSPGTDGVGADSATEDPGDPGAVAPDSAVSNPSQDPSSVPTNDPSMSQRGGEGPSGRASDAFAQPPAPFPPSFPGPSSAVGEDLAIRAVIISGVQSPWHAISRAPGVRNITLTGGLVALGKAPQSGETIGDGTPPSFLRITPDLRLLNGSIIPPVIPNIIDVRIVGYSVRADMADK